MLACVAEKDSLRGRGVWYYESLKGSGYRGEVELHKSVGEGHVFHHQMASWLLVDVALIFSSIV